jgi:hypothetical protein
VADKFPEVLEKMIIYAKEAHTPSGEGKVLGASKGFKGQNYFLIYLSI